MPSSAINVETSASADQCRAAAGASSGSNAAHRGAEATDRVVRRQMFGSKSERLVLQENPQQIALGEILDQGSAVAAPRSVGGGEHTAQ